MRITIIAASLDILGGHGVQARALQEELRSEGHEVSFLPVNPRFPTGLGWLRRYPAVRTLANQWLYLPSLLRLRRAADVVHVFSASYWSFLLGPVPAILAGRACGARVVLHYHSGEAEDHLTHWGALVHPWLRLVDAIVVPSEYLRDIFARFGYRARVIPNVVNTTSFRYRDRVPLRPRLLSTRNLEPYYRVGTIIEAFALLAPQYPQATLTIVGTGSQEAGLRRLARSLGVAPLFLGRVEPPAMPAIYDREDIFVNASVVDNQPVSILEAFSAGLPVISTPTGAIADMVREGETGSIVPPLDAAALAKAVTVLLENPDRAVAMARRAAAELDHHTWARVRHQWAAVYRGDEV